MNTYLEPDVIAERDRLIAAEQSELDGNGGKLTVRQRVQMNEFEITLGQRGRLSVFSMALLNFWKDHANEDVQETQAESIALAIHRARIDRVENGQLVDIKTVSSRNPKVTVAASRQAASYHFKNR